MNFIESKQCQSRNHCTLCRRLVQGKAWRATMLAKFDDVYVNWECPAGLAWLGRIPSADDLDPFLRIEAPLAMHIASLPVQPEQIVEHTMAIAAYLGETHQIVVAALKLRPGSGECAPCNRERMLAHVETCYRNLELFEQEQIQKCVNKVDLPTNDVLG